MKKLVMATNNEHKLREIRQILDGRFEVQGLADIGCHEDIPETADTLEGNALQKARYVHDHYGVDCFADDTGLEVEALDGAPGIYTARFGCMNGYGDSHDSEANIRCLLDKLKEKDNRRARFRTAIALIQQGEEHLFEGIVEGEILKEKTGTDGFGYDPIFAPVEAGVSFAQMGPQEKNNISHRGRATQKLAAFLRTTLMLLLFLVSPLLMAQRIGEWQAYPSYQIACKNLAVGSRVYCLTVGQATSGNSPINNYNLLSYDIKDTSVKTYNYIDDLNDVHIAHFGYSQEVKRFILVYDNGNIDLMDLEDHIVNISSLKESTLSGKTVNSIFVDGKMAYLCTGFGFITVDMSEAIIQSTYRLGVNVQQLTKFDGRLYIGTDKGLYHSTDDNLFVLQNWAQVNTFNGYLSLVPFDNRLFALHANGLYRLNGDTGNFDQVISNKQCRFLTFADGKMMLGIPTGLYVFSDATHYTAIEQNNQWRDLTYAKGTYWACEDIHGLKGYKLNGDTFSETVGSIQPESPVRDYSYRLEYVGDRLLVAGGINTTYAIYQPSTAMYYEDGKWTNFDEETPAVQYSYLKRVNTVNLVQDPNDPSHHYASHYLTGLYEYRDGKFVGLYNSENSPLRQIVYNGSPLGLNYVGCSGLKYDEDGNLWTMNLMTDTIIRVLQPSGKWLSLYYDEIKMVETPDDYLFTTSGVKFLISRRVDGRGFFGFHTNGTLNTVRDDKHLLRTTIVNQDGTSYIPDRFYCMTEDLDGRIWCGTESGLFVINDATTFFDSDFAFEQIKIARNDGSGLADYLLSGVVVTCIAVDGANRKWIGTNSNGVYLVSADGQEMIHHFRAEDSSLPSDNIQSLAIHPTTGLVMIGTDVGLCSYVSDATEAEEELNSDNIVAYPNPIGPDYTGPIAVRGLTMDGEVKICSSTGQLVWSGVSNGGTFTWNGCNKRGKRVASGVYHVIANTAAGKKAVVCRIIFIK